MRLKHRYVAVLAVLTLFIAGCSDSLVGRMAGDGSAESTVTFSVTDIPPQYDEMIKEAQNPASRSILPNAPFTPDNPSLTFILTGKSNSGEVIEKQISLSTAPHKFELKLGAYVWDLTLTAYKGYNAAASHHKPVLVGHCTVDLTMGNAKPEFKMSVKGLTTPGTVKVTGTVKDTDRVCTHYEIGIYNLYTGEFVEKYTDIDDSPKNTNAKLAQDVPSSATSPFPFTYEQTTPKITLNPGAYEYRMIFYKGTVSHFIPIGSYSDTIVVYPGNDLVQAIGELDVLNKKPTKPKELRAYLKDNSEDKEPDYYYVKLTWKPSRFETNYELMLKTSSDDGTTFPTAAEKIYGFKATNNTVEDFLASPIRHDGSLAYGSETCTLKLQLGKVYEVSIRAHNYIGESEWVERVNTPDPTPPANCTLMSTGGLSHINRRRIKYDLNGGKLILDAATPTANNTFTGVYVKYDSYTGTATPFLDIKPLNTVPLTGVSTLIREIPTTPPTTLEWRKWLNPNNGQEVTVTVPAGSTGIYKHENVFVKADFGSSLAGTVTPLPAPQDIPKTKIKITYDEESGSTNTTITPDASGHYPVPKIEGGKVMWITVQFDGLASTPEYDDLHCTAYFAPGAGLMSIVNIPAAGNVCKFSTGDYTPQTFTLKVMAKDTATHQMRSQTYIIDLY
ncbi:hypothetical protein [Treponema sp.]|uniref:hypothetical protein n=1 Tax=Treponema sp. TaxID=166 RepID=UPI003FA1B594